MNSMIKNASFSVIPVIDLMGGKVVRARHGQRHAYQPIQSQLCGSPEPQEVVRALLELYPFNTLYIADLDAIQRTGLHLHTIEKLRENHPHLEIWLDAGISSIADWRPWQHLGLHCVIGSESQVDVHQTRALMASIGHHRCILSLDMAAEGQRGPKSLFDDTTLWPERVIAMTLARVGSFSGVDMELLHSMLQHGKQIYAAGGVRNAEDLAVLKNMGITGALIASALHDAHINATDLAALLTA